MLSLTREKGERIMIGDDIIVEVVDVGYGKVRLGFIAPAEIPIHRLEVWEALKRDGRDFIRTGNRPPE
jgi:carbon storage regulator